MSECTCIHCRRKEFGDSYALHLYDEIMNGISVCLNLLHFDIKQDSLGEETIGSYLSCVKYNTDEYISLLFDEDEEAEKYRNYLIEHKLYDGLNLIVKNYNKLWEKE